MGCVTGSSFIRGTVDDAPGDHPFDAAACLFVLHFLPDDAKLGLLRGMARRIHPGGPALIVSGCRVNALSQGHLRDDLLGAWQQYGEMHGMQAAQMAAIVDELMARQAQGTTEEGYRELIRAAGFAHVANIASIMGNAMCAWIAR